mmetsp:Transcript_17501/g.43192  ORF Transcript_17501/g.43192 Transcript_17501/m.43192 type:complete len:408 (+) Transcript_17501:6475-7698(+)
MAKLKPFPALMAFILWVLMRDPDRRPKLDDLRIKFAALRQELTGGPTPTVAIANTDVERAGGLWVIGAGGGTPLQTRWPAASSAPKPTRLIGLFPTSTSSALKCPDMEVDTSAIWKLSQGRMAPAFNASSSLDTVFFADMDTLLGMPLCDSSVVAVLICTRSPSSVGCDVLGAKHEIDSNVVMRFCQTAAAVGIETHLASLPCMTTHGGGVQKQFSATMNSVATFAHRAIFLAGMGQGMRIMGGNVESIQRGRVLIVSLPNAAMAALAIAASIHMGTHDGGIRAATLALSPAATLRADAPTLHPTDVARLSAWEARVHADAAQLREESWIRCPTGCWSIAWKAPLSLSPHPKKHNPHQCSAARSGRCEYGCHGLHLGEGGACSAICASANGEAGVAIETLWCAYTTT